MILDFRKLYTINKKNKEIPFNMFRFHSLGPHFNGAYKAMNVILDDDSSQGTGALWLGDFTAA